jgi:hypothetical protein
MGRFLFDFSYQRKPVEAIGFYLSHFIIALLAGAVVGAAIGVIGAAMKTIVLAGVVLAVLYSVILTLLTVQQKGISSSYYLLALLAGILAVVLGALGGLIPVTILLTRPSSSLKDN